jgi:cation diffusion facilitator family transporter
MPASRDNITVAGEKDKASPLLLSLVLNLIFAIGKGVAAFFGNSNALMADAGESLSDVFTSFIVWVGIITSIKEPDEDHPYGHGKAEPLASIAVATFLMIASILIASRGVERLWIPPEKPHKFTLLVLLAVIFFKELLYRYLRHKSKDVKSNAMLAEALHSRSDAITSFMALVGITISIYAGPKYIAADAYSSLIASVIIAYNAIRIFRPAFNEIMDAAPKQELINNIKSVAGQVEGVNEIEKCLVRKMGMKYLVDMHVVVNADLSVKEGHSIAHRVKDAVRNKLPEILDVLIHIEPARS